MNALESFAENARDLTVRHGLRTASLLFTFGNVYLMGRYGFDLENAKFLRHLAAPSLMLAANVAGLFNCERLQNTLVVAGSAVMTASFAGVDEGDTAIGQTALWAGGALTGVPGSYLASAKQRRMEKSNLTGVFKDGMVQTATIHGGGSLAFLGLAFAENTLDMIVPYGAWSVAAVLKATRAILNARQKISRAAEPKAA